MSKLINSVITGLGALALIGLAAGGVKYIADYAESNKTSEKTKSSKEDSSEFVCHVGDTVEINFLNYKKMLVDKGVDVSAKVFSLPGGGSGCGSFLNIGNVYQWEENYGYAPNCFQLELNDLEYPSVYICNQFFDTPDTYTSLMMNIKASISEVCESLGTVSFVSENEWYGFSSDHYYKSYGDGDFKSVLLPTLSLVDFHRFVSISSND